MINKSTWLCLSLLWLSLTSIAQNNQKFKRLTSEIGINLQTTLDQRFTANAVQYTGFQTRTGFEFGTPQKFNRIELSFAKNFERWKNISSYINLNSGIRYIHLSVTKKPSLLIGGYVDYGNLLIIPEGGAFENNPIAYSFWLSIGPALKWQRSIRIKQKSIHLSVEGSFPLVGYVIRPAYAHPYPDNYLVDGRFDFDRKGMWGYLLKSGKIESLNQFINTKLKTTCSIPFGKKAHAIGLSYHWEFLWINRLQKLWHNQQQLSFFLKINLHAK